MNGIKVGSGFRSAIAQYQWTFLLHMTDEAHRQLSNLTNNIEMTASDVIELAIVRLLEERSGE